MKFAVQDRQANALTVFAADRGRGMAANLVDDPLQYVGFQCKILEAVPEAVKDQPGIGRYVTVDDAVSDARGFLRPLAETVGNQIGE
ncbi:hypothetical protein [Sphingomonas sp. LC-1]|uniref:hypothetical protein n=1 Tax=Sphingomonas sp. LC-1 TaxID=3110957 RepID=UPI0021BB9683|nr:hypothetical protein [Sphingomonas sp. LC-1]